MSRLSRIRLNVRDLAAARDFYVRALGFEAVGPSLLRLGVDELELTPCDPASPTYPQPRTAADPWFQHFAIVVADMPRAYAHLRAVDEWEPISQGGPELLPPSTGSVTAFKFRDPDGHPLELSFVPKAPRADPAGPGLFLGIDHSALAVSRMARSVAFYRDLLGLTIAPTLVNAGPTQARLDGLRDPVVDIVAAHPVSGPHIE